MQNTWWFSNALDSGEQSFTRQMTHLNLFCFPSLRQRCRLTLTSCTAVKSWLSCCKTMTVSVSQQLVYGLQMMLIYLPHFSHLSAFSTRRKMHRCHLVPFLRSFFIPSIMFVFSLWSLSFHPCFLPNIFYIFLFSSSIPFPFPSSLCLFHFSFYYHSCHCLAFTHVLFSHFPPLLWFHVTSHVSICLLSIFPFLFLLLPFQSSHFSAILPLSPSICRLLHPFPPSVKPC